MGCDIESWVEVYDYQMDKWTVVRDAISLTAQVV
jgi:hypothetical protein